jgi:hypothetical protein
MEKLDAHDYERAKNMKEAHAAIDHMRRVAERRLAQLLLARFLLLSLLVEEAQNLPGGLQQKEHRRLWVLLQAYPKIFNEVDIFTKLTELLRGADTSSLQERIEERYTKLVDLREKVVDPATGKDETPPFFCVLDEVQITVTTRMGEFISDDKSIKRPILRQIWLSWTTLLNPFQMRLVLSGTGIELQALQDTLSSNALKRQPYHLTYDVGAFEDPDIQAKYIKRYVPAPWSKPHWEKLLTRAWAWLHGR